MSTLTPQEREVMERWEAGWRAVDIARELGLPLHRVRKVVNTFSPSLREQRWASDVRAASDRLAAACAAAGGRFL